MCNLRIFCRTTTQTSDFDKGGNREDHKYKEFLKDQYEFEKTCYLDFDERPYSDIQKDKFDSFTIEKRGHLPESIIKDIFTKCIKKFLIKPQIVSVRDSLSKSGVSIK